MTIFRILSGLSIAALFLALALDLRRRGKNLKSIWQGVQTQSQDTLKSWRERKQTGTVNALDSLRRITFGISAAFFIVLAATGFTPVLVIGQHLSGILLIIHVTVAPLFALSLTALALLWAHRMRFEEMDRQYLLSLRNQQPVEKQLRARLLLKIGFWLILFLALPLLLTIFLGLFPLFGTDGEEFLIRGHGYSALLLFLMALAEMYLVFTYVHHSADQSVKEKAT